MNVWIFTVVHNDAEMLRWFLRYYSTFATKIVVWDDASTDETRQLLMANSKVELFKWPHRPGLNEDILLGHAQTAYPMAAGIADWCMWVDCDEFIIPPSPRATLDEIFESEEKRGTEVIQTIGYNIVGSTYGGLPPYIDSVYQKQLFEILPFGVGAPIYSKPVVFKPTSMVRWTRGKHALENCRPVLSLKPRLKLLHFRYLSEAYTAARNAKNYERVGADKGPAWSCAPDYNGPHLEGSPLWAGYAKKLAFNVVAQNI